MRLRVSFIKRWGTVLIKPPRIPQDYTVILFVVHVNPGGRAGLRFVAKSLLINKLMLA